MHSCAAKAPRVLLEDCVDALLLRIMKTRKKRTKRKSMLSIWLAKILSTGGTSSSYNFLNHFNLVSTMRNNIALKVPERHLRPWAFGF